MELFLNTGEKIDLPSGTKIPFTFLNPLFNDIGSHTSSFFIPRTARNNKLFNCYNAGNQFFTDNLDAFIQLKTIRFSAEISIIDVYDTEIKIFIAFFTGQTNGQNKNKKLTEVDYDAATYAVGEDEYSKWQYFRRDDWDSINDGFAVFPVYMPNWFGNSEGTKLGFPLAMFESENLELGEFWNRISENIVNKCWTDHANPNNSVKIFWEHEVTEDSETTVYRFGSVVIFPFLSYILEKALKHLGLRISRSIMNDFEELKRLHIFNNRDVVDRSEAVWKVDKFSINNAVPDMKITSFLKELQKHLGLFISPSLYDNKVEISSFSDIINRLEVTDITKISNKQQRIRSRSNRQLIFNIPTYANNRPNKWVNGYFVNHLSATPDNEDEYFPICPPVERPSPYALNPEENMWWGTDPSGTLGYIHLSREFINEQLKQNKAINLESKTRTLGSANVNYQHYNDRFIPPYPNDPFKIDMPFDYDLQAWEGLDYSNRIKELILIYNSGKHNSGNIAKSGGNFANAMPIDGYGNEFGKRSLHLDQNGVIDGWQKQYTEWLRFRKKEVEMFVDWEERYLTEFFFTEKFKIYDTIYLVNKIKGNFIAGNETEFNETIFFSL